MIVVRFDLMSSRCVCRAVLHRLELGRSVSLCSGYPSLHRDPPSTLTHHVPAFLSHRPANKQAKMTPVEVPPEVLKKYCMDVSEVRLSVTEGYIFLGIQ